jgi:HEAT repeat protein
MVDDFIKKYLNRIIAEDNDIGISEVYTELSAKEILPIKLKHYNQNDYNEKKFEILELVKKEQKLIISGDPGSGKTITLKWLNFIYATSCLQNKEENIPLYVELNSYTKGSFYDYVKIKAKGKGISEAALKKLLKGKAIILIDGLDMLSSTNEFLPYNEISIFVSKYNDCRFVISSRPGFIKKMRSDFKEAVLEGLTDKKIQIFIDKYVEDAEIKNFFSNEILKNQELNSILTNPMMLYLTIIVAIDRNTAEEKLSTFVEWLPINRSELYSTFISNLFEHHDRKREILHAERTQIEDALIDLCFELQRKNKVSCKYKEALGIVKKHADDDTFRKTTSQDILEDLVNLGLLKRKDSDIEYGIHQSFQEYFAAKKLKELVENGFDISDTFRHPKWEEVVIFTSEMVDSVDKFIDLMLSKKYPNRTYQPELFLASKCITKASSGTKEKLCTLLADKMDSKYKMDKINSIESLARVGDDAISILFETLKDEDCFELESVAEALGSSKSEKTIQLLNDALKDKNEMVRQYAAQALGKIGSEKAVHPLIIALKDENEYVRHSVVEALGKIGSEEAVESLIYALKHEDKVVKWKVAEALGNIGSEKAVSPLIEALKDENLYVWSSAVVALGKIGSEKAIQALIDVLNDENEEIKWVGTYALRNAGLEKVVQPQMDVLKDENEEKRWVNAWVLRNIQSEIPAKPPIDKLKTVNKFREMTFTKIGNLMSEATVQPLIEASKNKDLKDEDLQQYLAELDFRKICTSLDKKQLEDMPESEHKLSSNTAFEILNEIKKEERSKIILFEKELLDRKEEVDSGRKSQEIKLIQTGSEGIKDAYFGNFVDKIKSIKEPTTIVDYGCGEGKLLCAMKTLPKKALKNISYIGVDLLTRCRYLSRLTAEKHGLIKEFKNEPEFLKPESFLSKDITVDLVFFMHVIHEIRLIYLVDLIYSLSSKVKIGGKIFILDQKKLVEEERSFVLFDEVKDFKVLFNGSGFKPYVRHFPTGSGKQLISIEIEKVEDKCFTREDAGKNCLAVFEAKKAKLMEKRKRELTDKEYSEISIQFTNISEQIAEYERVLHLYNYILEKYN